MYLKNFIMLLKRYTVSSALNILGMAVAFAAVYLIMVQVNFDLSYNKGIPNAQNIYRFEYPDWSEEGYWTTCWSREMPDFLCKNVAEIEKCGSVWPSGGMGNVYSEYSRKHNDGIENFTLNLSEAEKEGLDIFGLEIIEGSFEELISPNTLLLKESTAKKYGLSAGDVLYFGREANEANSTVTVVAVCKDPYSPSILDDCDGWAGMQPQENEDPTNFNTPYYISLHNGISRQEGEKKIIDFFTEHLRKQGASDENIAETMKQFRPRLNPLTELYFSRDVVGYSSSTGNKTTTYSLLAIAILIIVIALINFVNFFFALIPVRIRAINTYKIFGAPTLSLRLNFLVETLGLIAIALGCAAIIIGIFAETPFTEYLSTTTNFIENWKVTAGVVSTAIIAGIIVSIYPAWYITRFSPAMVLGGFHTTAPGKRLRYTLIAVQYSISIILIICSLFMHSQHKYMLTYDMGFNKENLLTVTVPGEAILDGYDENNGISYTKRDAFVASIKENPSIADITFCDGNFIASKRMVWGRDVNEESLFFQVCPVSWNFLKVMGIEITEGRNFESNDELRNQGVYIFNNDAAQKLGINTKTKINGHNGVADVVGICENFNFRPMQYNIEPFAFYVFGKHPWGLPRRMYVRTAAGADIPAVREYIMNTIAEFAPNTPADSYDVAFFSNELEKHYDKEKKLGTLMNIFTILSIFISMIGVFGLVLFETQYRQREIGIRRVHGATVGVILKMFNIQYLRIVAICSVISIPVSVLIVKQWSMQFAYQAPLALHLFIIAIAAVAAITIATVTLRAYKAANENPVDAISR